MNKLVIAILGGLLLWSCTSNNMNAERISVQPCVLNDELYTVMPGDLVLNNEYLVWSDPFSQDDYFLHVHSVQNGKELGVMGKIGEGPTEFVTPSISRHCIENNIIAKDANGNTAGYLSIDSLVNGKEPFRELPDSVKQLKMVKLDSGLYISRTEDGNENYFKSVINEKESYWGVYPVSEVKEHVGGYDAYDAKEGIYVYASFNFPYLALYQRNGDTFQLKWERRAGEKNYQISDDGRLVFDRKIMGAGDVCLSKDYIITLERDRKVDPMDESTVGRNISKCPQTVFLYDYDGNLLKIVNLSMPVMRIAADRRNNILYAIGAKPDYVLSKFEL